MDSATNCGERTCGIPFRAPGMRPSHATGGEPCRLSALCICASACGVELFGLKKGGRLFATFAKRCQPLPIRLLAPTSSPRNFRERRWALAGVRRLRSKTDGDIAAFPIRKPAMSLCFCFLCSACFVQNEPELDSAAILVCSDTRHHHSPKTLSAFRTHSGRATVVRSHIDTVPPRIAADMD